MSWDLDSVGCCPSLAKIDFSFQSIFVFHCPLFSFPLFLCSQGEARSHVLGVMDGTQSFDEGSSCLHYTTCADFRKFCVGALVKFSRSTYDVRDLRLCSFLFSGAIHFSFTLLLVFLIHIVTSFRSVSFECWVEKVGLDYFFWFLIVFLCHELQLSMLWRREAASGFGRKKVYILNKIYRIKKKRWNKREFEVRN